jgi:hemolysin III
MSHDHNRETERFSFPFFVFIITATLASLFLTLFVFFPNILREEVSASITMIVAVVLGTHLCGAFVEFFFHRYVLHAPVIPFLSYFYRQHTHHHSRTRVTVKRSEGTVENYYPILEEKQHEASFFPWYSLFVFSGIATPVFVLVKWSATSLPVFIGGYCGITLSMCLYEILHAIEHKALDWWRPRIDNARYGRIWRTLYGFHLMHHASIKSNESISGFFGIPLPDFIFGTYGKPHGLYKHGTVGLTIDFVAPEPVFFIRWLDHLAEKMVRRYRARKVLA